MIGLAIIIALIAINGLFVAMEFVIVGARLSRLEAVSNRAAGIADKLDGAEAQDRYVAVAQLGITLASIGLGMYGEHQIALWLEAPLHSLGIEGASVHVFALILAVVLLTYFHVVFGEMIPKAMALKGAERLLVTMWPVISFFEIFFRPLVWLLNVISQALLRVFGLDGSAARFYTPREIGAIAEDSSEGGSISAEQGKFINNIVQLQSRRTDELMTPRRYVLSIDLNEGVDDLEGRILGAGPSRLPVVEGNLDTVLGVVHVRDVIAHQTRGDGPVTEEVLRSILRPLPRVLASLDTAVLLDTMRRGGTHMALVTDETGTALGAITFEDAIEEIVGEVHSEFEIEDRNDDDLKGTRRIPGTMPLRKVREHFDVALVSDRARTIAGLVLEELRRAPRKGDTCERDGLRLEVDEVDGLAIVSLTLHRMSGAVAS